MEMQSEGTSQTLYFEGTLYLWGYIDVKFTGCSQSFERESVTLFD